MTKADFKALRELLGMSQKVLANMLHVDVRSVRRWEKPGIPWTAPQDAWDTLERYRDRQREQVAFAINEAEEAQNVTGATDVFIRYWDNAQEYEEAHEGEGYLYQMANATIRLIKAELEQRGYTVTLDYELDTEFCMTRLRT